MLTKRWSCWKPGSCSTLWAESVRPWQPEALRPMKTIFIFFLRHQEGICLKDRANYADEISSIYAVISPETSETVREQRMVRLLSPLDNSFSEKLTNLNKRLEEILGKEQSPIYKIQGSNGHPRKIPLSTIYVEWE